MDDALAWNGNWAWSLPLIVVSASPARSTFSASSRR
jgi:hypothetical protein